MQTILATKTENSENKDNKQKIQSHQFLKEKSLAISIDFFLLSCAYFTVNFLKRDTLILDAKYFFLYILLIAAWGLVSIWTKKFRRANFTDYKTAFMHLAKSVVFIIYLISVVLYMVGIYNVSRLQIFGSSTLFFVLEYFYFTVITTYSGIKNRDTKIRVQSKSEGQFKNFSLSLLVLDFFLLTAAFYFSNYLKRDTFTLSDQYQDVIFVVYALWLTTSILTRKFQRQNYRNFYYAITPFIKTVIMMAAIMAVIIFASHMFYLSRLQIYGGFALFLVFEIIFYLLYFISGIENGMAKDIDTAEEVQQVFQDEELPLEEETTSKLRERIKSVANKLQKVYLHKNPELFNFLSTNLDLRQIDESETIVQNTHTMFNIETIENHSVSLFINLHRVNDFRYLNRYFLEVHKKIYNGGYLVGCVDTIATHRDRFFKKFNWLIASALYPIDFIYRRMLPKLPGLKKVYFLFTRGKSRVLSKSETYGRLYFCGFKLANEEVIDDTSYFIFQRVKNPSIDKSPSYGATIKLRRVGLNGKIMFISKFRTMHPYSEYLQQYIFEQNKLHPTGKFKDDFRITEWGKVMRKLWIDELPQLVNFIRGDIALVGVRALSEHYFSLYPEEIQELRIKFKPGLIPPFYADMPKSFDEILKSEQRYLEAKKGHPFITDIRYFFKAVYNIIFKNARSG